MFHFWFNTSFLDESGLLILDKNMLDKAHQDKNDKKFDKNFRIEVHVEFVTAYRQEGNRAIENLSSMH